MIYPRRRLWSPLDAIELYLTPARTDRPAISLFFQRCLNRLGIGGYQYQSVRGLGGEVIITGPQRRHKYMTRMKLEMKAYKRTGNSEHLYNIANYCYLENESPENTKFHDDHTIGSVTRKVGVGCL